MFTSLSPYMFLALFVITALLCVVMNKLHLFRSSKSGYDFESCLRRPMEHYQGPWA